ncbi:MAG: hypothetical protein QN174_03235 [Armatimonadota bacterium]|nr:hypothetical protein [Armatimonadota bacterium]MDR7455462.1 hypothetical protein [Armatimonadota bacterium]MDR7456002.1 hypothetical protein [Armatimonadota bacterium]MDR7495961.1 hypothetical protein [Armatimonadota bacterium]MDR7511277.1 hypothetical protein [Armatimonadota bacterium]
MRPIWLVAAALIVAAGLAAQGGVWQATAAGPETVYLVHRWTGEARLVTGRTWEPVRPVGRQQDDFRK